MEFQTVQEGEWITRIDEVMTMRYTYRNECLIRDNDDKVGFIAVIVLSCIDLGFYLVGLVFYLRDRDKTFLVCGAAATIVVLSMLWSLKTSIKTRRRIALERRYKALTEGIRCPGKIIDAGKKIETEDYQERDKNGNWKTYHRKVPNYWVDVEYTDPLSGGKQRIHEIYMVRDMKHLIGRDVDVYVWQERSEFSQWDFIHTYVDTYSL